MGHTLRWYEIGLITQLDNIIFDARLNMTMPGGVDPRVVILDIDEKSLGEVGRWPWSRNVMAQLMDKLFGKYGVLLVGFDVVWAERDTSSGMDTLEALARQELKEVSGFQSAFKRLRPQLDFDGMFAASIKDRPVVLGYYFNAEENAVKANAIPPPVLSRETFAGRAINFPRWKGYTGNLSEYVKNAAGAGHFNPLVDDDGVSRRVPMILEFEGEYYEALSLAMLRALIALQTGAAPRVEPGLVPPSFDYPGLEWLKVADYVIPVDERAAVLIPYRGRKFSYPYIALADVLKDRVDPGQLKGRIAIVGTTAPGLLDQRSTPVGSVYPGVEIHANMITGVLDGTLKSKPPYMLGAEVLLLLVGGVALSILIPMLSALWATASVLLGVALVTAIDFMVWSMADLVLPLATSILMVGAMYTVNMAYGYFVESRSKRQFTELFGQYVPPELVDRMAADPEKYTMEPKAAELTILFSDVRGFTSISEALKPEELREYINQYLTTMSGIIRARYNGTLDKYIGDAIMAFWGAPVEDPQHARNGVLAALEMQGECKVLNDKFTARGWPALKIGVGVNTGGVRVGDMGSQVRRAYTVMGDPVNVASRLEGRTKTYGIGILVGEATRAAVKDVLFREIDRIKVKGKDEAIAIYEPLGLESEVDQGARNELDLWDDALAAYRAQRWDEAEAGLAKLQGMNPECGLYQAYAERVDTMRDAALPDDWDGVTVFHEK
ncbi:MAG: adenylate/guanylate cyclase domain-containing protein [Betaproteobacteria bacterium]|nr:adenylate/guanylate cyclase domain-containing protein [Betaproteobacteria bacterium]